MCLSFKLVSQNASTAGGRVVKFLSMKTTLPLKVLEFDNLAFE